MHIKKGDNVLVITGKDKGKEGKVLTSMPSDNRVIVEGINIQKRHTKPRSAQATGGILDKAGAIDASNVMVICPVCKKATRVAAAMEGDKKYRACKKCSANLDKKAEKKEKAEKKTAAKKPAAKKTAAKKAEAQTE